MSRIRPSSLPALYECPAFEGDHTGNEYTEAGTGRHATLSKAIGSDWKLPAGLDEETEAGLQWALDYVQVHAPMHDHPIVCEQRASFIGPDFSEVTGTPDIVCGRVIFDLKWRQADYEAQMAAYALMILEKGWQSVEVHVLFAQPKRARVYRWELHEAQAIVFPIIERALAGAEPRANEFCDWCSKKLTCPAVQAQVNAVVTGRPDYKLSTWHASEIQSPEEMGKALEIARCVADWAKSVEHHAKEMAVKQGKIPVGFQIQSRQGNRYITSLQEAFAKSGLPQNKFLEACEVKLSALTEVYAEAQGLKKAPAEREVTAKLGDTVQRKSPTLSLVRAD